METTKTETNEKLKKERDTLQDELIKLNRQLVEQDKFQYKLGILKEFEKKLGKVRAFTHMDELLIGFMELQQDLNKIAKF